MNETTGDTTTEQANKILFDIITARDTAQKVRE